MTQAWKQWEGQVVNGEFRLYQYLGGSDHSAVFLTEQGERELRKAAIKFIPADGVNAELQLSRWGLATRLSHPHLIRLFQMGRCHLDNLELLYVVMEYAEEDLSEVLPHRPLTLTEGREMLEPVLEVLEYVHREGFVHGHMKPANIMAVDDQLKVSSDGLCQMGESRCSLGKPSLYDPPEKGGVSPAGDVWSLGMTLVEALTQRLPVWEVLEQGQLVLPETVPAPFLDLACHCLDRDPRQRWTVAEIAAQLKQTSGAPQEQEQKVVPAPREASANWRSFIPTVAVALALAAVILAVPMLLHRRPEVQRTPSITSEQPRVQPRPEQSRVVPRPGQSTEKTNDEKPSSSGTARLTAPSRSEAASVPSADLVRGEVLQRVLPDVSQRARDTIRGTVRVSLRVHVDPSGRVVGTTFDSPGPSKYFANLASQAARRWEFSPPKVNHRYVSSEWILRFEFGRTATK